MTKAILEIYRNSDPEGSEPWAWDAVGNAEIIPAVGDDLVFRSPQVGGHDASYLTVKEVRPLASLDGVLIIMRIAPEEDEPLYLLERALRRDLLGLNWVKVGPARPLVEGVDLDDYEGLDGF